MPQLVVDLAEVVGSTLSLLALVVALYALWVSRRDLVRERRHQIEDRRRHHELEILRRIGLALGSSSADADREQITTLLMLLPPRTDFPLTRAALQVWPRAEATTRLVDQIRYDIRHRPTPPAVAEDWTPDVRWEFVSRRRRATDRSVVRDELNAAIAVRIDADGEPVPYRDPILPTLTRSEPPLPKPPARPPAPPEAD
ncbi:hypothetical protein WHI96_02150 [Pseudonocardia tropica]|uniref:Secreted protein n=1 Tax=Pseudonocardia tropica TaxID=681289 RepID=A0ABV1JQ51_9PSEU